MKKTKLALVALAISAVILFAFSAIPASTIKGSVTPAGMAIKAWAISPTDTLSANVLNGEFEIKDVKPGTYSVVIEAQAPYAATRRRDVVVKADVPVTDIGEIKLQPK
jgi:hypothetical protein